MMLRTRTGEEVEVEIQYERYVEDSFFCSGSYVDRDVEVSAETLDELTQDYPEIIEEAWREWKQGAAEARADALEDR